MRVPRPAQRLRRELQFPCNTGLIGVFLAAYHRHEGFLQNHSRMHGPTTRRGPSGRWSLGRLMGHFPAMGLTAKDLACVRGGQIVFSGLHFSVKGGQAMAVTGANGVGKTTLLRLLAGLLRPSHGILSRWRARRATRRAGALSRPSGRPQAGADGRRKPGVLDEVSRW